jgi:uncharacterized protein YxeA
MKGMKDYLLMLLVVVLFIAGSTIAYHEEVALTDCENSRSIKL